MNARSRALVIEPARNPMVIQCLTAVLAALLLFNLATAIASADKVTNFKSNLTQNQFTGDCRLMGGTPKREDTHVVSCTLGSGSKTTCDFNKTPAECVNVQGGAKAAPAASGSVLEAVETTGQPVNATQTQNVQSEPALEANPTQVTENNVTAAPAGEIVTAEPVETPGTDAVIDDVESLPAFGQ